MWCACSVCGAERWVIVRKGIPQATMCKICGPKNHGPNWTYHSGPMHPNWKGGRFSDGHGYIRIRVGKGKHPRADCYGCVYEHVLIVESTLGRKLLPGEVVHHLDSNPENNDPANLEVLPSTGDHIRRYGVRRKLFDYRHEIRRRYAAGGISTRQLAIEYGCAYSAIQNIVRRKVYEQECFRDE